MTPENYNDDDLDLMGGDYTESHSYSTGIKH